MKLHQLRETFLALSGELSSHMMKEERMLFPKALEMEKRKGIASHRR